VNDAENGSALKALEIETPAFVYDEQALLRNLSDISSITRAAGARLLFSIKSFPLTSALDAMVPRLDGFATSSLFEAMLGREVLDMQGTVHITTPGLRPDEIGAIRELCDYVTLNSLLQWTRFGGELVERAKCGLRVNPQLSLVSDPRCDPCRRHSKLGVPLEQLVHAWEVDAAQFDGLSGLHFHNNRASTDFGAWLTTVRHLARHLGPLLRQLEWINFGGGYLFDEAHDCGPFRQAVELSRANYGLEVFVEPGASITRKAGYFVSTVLDLFRSDDKTVAVLDTTINHMPEVFEYQFAPDVVGAVKRGPHRYVLAGCTCVAGDVFGEYALEEPLEVGSRVVIANVGAYTLVKANMFNGVNLPAIYSLTGAGEPVLLKRYAYDDFASRWRAAPSLPLRERA
jgi:carboxynorspermidine decarboxylase